MMDDVMFRDGQLLLAQGETVEMPAKEDRLAWDKDEETGLLTVPEDMRTQSQGKS